MIEEYELWSWWYHDRPHIEEDEDLFLWRDYGNKYDDYAVKIETISNKTVGYIPRESSEMIYKKLSGGDNLTCTVMSTEDKDLHLPPRVRVCDDDGVDELRRKKKEADENAKRSFHKDALVLSIGSLLTIFLLMTSCVGFFDKHVGFWPYFIGAIIVAIGTFWFSI